MLPLGLPHPQDRRCALNDPSTGRGCVHPFNTKRRRRRRSGDVATGWFGNKQEKVQVAAGRVGVFLFVKKSTTNQGTLPYPRGSKTTAKSLNGEPITQDEGGPGIGRKERTTLASQPDEGDASAETRLFYFAEGEIQTRTRNVSSFKRKKMGLSRDDEEVYGP